VAPTFRAGPGSRSSAPARRRVGGSDWANSVLVRLPGVRAPPRSAASRWSTGGVGQQTIEAAEGGGMRHGTDPRPRSRIGSGHGPMLWAAAQKASRWVRSGALQRRGRPHPRSVGRPQQRPHPTWSRSPAPAPTPLTADFSDSPTNQGAIPNSRHGRRGSWRLLQPAPRQDTVGLRSPVAGRTNLTAIPCRRSRPTSQTRPPHPHLGGPTSSDGC
jgi:hypothetical protein